MIPASEIVSVNPGVIAAGGSQLQLLGLMLTTDTRVPVGEVQSFATAQDVADFFGPVTDEAAAADIYFSGYENALGRPGAMLFTQYNDEAVGPYLRGGALDMTLAELTQLAAGTVIITINGVPHTSASIDLSDASSFSNAATQIQAGLASYDAVGTAAIAATTMTVAAVAQGAYAVGQVVSGSGVTPGTVITALGTGTGGTGTYTVSPSQTAASTTMSAGPTTVTYDSVSDAFIIAGGTPGVTGTIGIASGTLSAGVKLTSATGAVLSQGAAPATPAAFMNAVVQETSNWASFSTLWEPSADDKEAFATWNATKNDRFMYVLWETSLSATNSDGSSLALADIIAAEAGGVFPLWQPTDLGGAAFVMGVAASIDFSIPEGRTTFAFRRQDGLVPGVTDASAAAQLLTNGYNFYGDYATANDQFNFLYSGQVTGDFLWADSYINQIWLNNALQLALLNLLLNTPSIPYNAAGYAQIEQACMDPINAALLFGAIRSGVLLSSAQAAAVNNAAGRVISDTLTQRGWYLLITPATAEQRAARVSPPMTLFYMDGQSVQKLNLTSLAVQ